MNTDLTFRFVTRTKTEDYRVFGDGGRETYSDSTEFEPLRKKGRIIPEEGACAVLWEEDGRIFLTVSSMQRGVKDFANRPIRFSFCEIFVERAEAWGAFTRIISDFPQAEKFMQPLVHEVQRPDGEDVDFEQEEFMTWLKGTTREVKFTECMEGDVITREGESWPEVWPPEGMLLKWRKTEDDEISCERLNVPERQERYQPQESPEPQEREMPKWILPVVSGVVVAVIAGVYLLMTKPAVKTEPVGNGPIKPAVKTEPVGNGPSSADASPVSSDASN